MVENTCHISVLMKSTSANTSSSGTARDRTETDASSWSIRRGPVQRRIDSTPYRMSPKATASTTRLAPAVTSALPHCPPNISGSAAGTRTKAASSAAPTFSGSDRKGRLRTRLSRPNAPIRMPRPPTQAAMLAITGQSSWIAPSSSPKATSTSSGAARVQTSSRAE